MKALIIGGTKGLGLSLAKKLTATGASVTITGRKDPRVKGVEFVELDLGADDLINHVQGQIWPKPDVLIYAAGFYQEGKLDELDVEDIDEMLSVGLAGPIHICRELLFIEGTLPGFIAITSTSQRIPRLLEPVYTAAKAGLGMFAKSLSLDPRVKKTLVAAPAGMSTEFWSGTDKDTASMLDPDWVADRILEQYQGAFNFKEVQILRDPPRVEIVESL